MKLWWSSLGVAMSGNGNGDFAPSTGKAGYSYAGLEKFKEVLQERLPDHTISLGDRILAMLFEIPQQGDFPIPEGGKARVWFREMLEPTISTFKLREGHG